ncbi:hypothetical protein GCM10009416_02730 [Craurococcus roseus]|uniref:Uncharacterized protein n=1 Tax=Craurococcus roseus TaxID=77585 RepID=A0ABN1EJT5_9PROT
MKRRFSTEKETVAVPIDVAIISKTEGFVWVKRKHYFDKELNPGYFVRKYGVSATNAGRREGGDAA